MKRRQLLLAMSELYRPGRRDVFDHPEIFLPDLRKPVEEDYKPSDKMQPKDYPPGWGYETGGDTYREGPPVTSMERPPTPWKDSTYV